MALVKLHHVSWVTTVVIAVQMVLGGIIVGTDSGFSVPSWPLFGNTQLTALSLFEIVHRLIALFSGILFVWLAVQVFTSYSHNRAMVWTCVLGLLSLFIQMIYAGLIVLFMFPGWASTVDVLNSVVMLSLFIHLSNLAKLEYNLQQGLLTNEPDSEYRALTRSSWILYITGMLSVAAGAVFRHTGASQALFGKDDYLVSHGQYILPSSAMSHWMLFIHILSVGVLVVVTVQFTMVAFKHRRLTNMATFMIALMMIQSFLGIASLSTRLELVVVTLHWGITALTMGVAAFTLSQTYVAKKPLSDSALSQAGLLPLKKKPARA